MELKALQDEPEGREIPRVCLCPHKLFFVRYTKGLGLKRSISANMGCLLAQNIQFSLLCSNTDSQW